MHSMRAILEDQYFVGLQASALAADASRNTPFFIALFAIRLTRAWVASFVAVVGQNTNTKHIQLIEGVSGSALATYALTLGNDLVENVATDLSFIASGDDLIIPSGNLLLAKLFQAGGGMDVPQHVLGIVFKPI